MINIKFINGKMEITRFIPTKKIELKGGKRMEDKERKPENVKISFYDIDNDEQLYYFTFEEFLEDLKDTFEQAKETGDKFRIDFGILKEPKD